MENLKEVALNRALAMLRAAGCSYIVLDPEMNRYVHGDVYPVKEQPKPSKRQELWAKKGRKYGDIAAYIKPYIDSLEIGDVVVVPYGPFVEERVRLQASLSSTCSKRFGNGSHLTHLNEQGVELLRVL